MDSSSVETIEENIKSIADHPFAKAAGVERSVRSAIQWLSYEDHEWLLIFDNADGDPNTIGKYVPPGMRGNILFTSRNRMMGHHVLSSNAHVEVEEMTEEQAISLLLKSAMLDESSSDIIPLSRAIVKELWCLPLAVDQAGATIARRLCSVYDYLELYAKSRKELLALSFFQGASDYGLPVYTTFELSHKAIRDCTSGGSDLMTPQAAKIALFILGIFAFFHNENISENIIKRAAEETFGSNYLFLHKLVPSELFRCHDSGEWDPLAFRAGIQILCSFSLVKANDSNGNSYSMHSLIHSWSLDRMSNEDKRQSYFLSSTLLANSITFNDEDRAFRRELIPHLTSWMSHRRSIGRTTSFTENQVFKFENTFLENGLYNAAEELQLEVFELRRRVLGAEHPYTLGTMHSLASTYIHQGRTEEAKQLQRQVLESRRRVLGVEHPDTLATMHNLASTYNRQGQMEEAEQLQLQILESRRRVLGVEHPDTLGTMHNLASTYNEQGRTEEAEQLFLQVLESRRRVLRAEHPDTLMTMHNLAWTCNRQGRMEEAEQLQLQILESRRRVLGMEHPDTLMTMHNLASTYNEQGRTDEAEQLFLQVLESRRRVLRAEHPDTLMTMHNFAWTCNLQGRMEEAEQLQLQILESRRRVLGMEHPDTLMTMHNLAWTYNEQGRTDEAEQLYLQVLESRRRVLRVEHPDTLRTMQDLANTQRAS